MRSSTWFGGWLCALVVTGVFGSAAAQSGAPGVALLGDPPGYRELVDEAVTEQRVGHFGEARALFTRAHNLYPNARTLKGLGMAEFELRNYRESAQYLEASIASTVKPLTPELRSEADQLLARAQRFLGKVRVLISPSTTQIAVDGAVAPFGADGSVLLAAGDHTIDASAIGHEPAHQTIKVNGGDDQTITFQLTPIAGAAPGSAATIPAAVGAPAPEPESASEKPRGFRLYAGGLVGFAGEASGESLAVSYGLDLGATFFTVPFFDFGAELRLVWFKPSVASERGLLIDINVKPRVRFDFAQRRAEFYFAFPVGLAIPSLPGSDSGEVGWNLGAGAGITYSVSKNVGINAEAMMLFHSFGGTTAAYDSFGGTTYDANWSLFVWQPALFVNLVVTPMNEPIVR